MHIYKIYKSSFSFLPPTTMYRWDLEWDTMRIVNEELGVAYETVDTSERPMPNDVFVTHDLNEWHRSILKELKDKWQKPIPARFRDIVDDLEK